MARSHRLNRRWCGTHQMHYPAWADEKAGKLGTCFMCDDEKARAEAAHQCRTEQVHSKTEGSP